MRTEEDSALHTPRTVDVRRVWVPLTLLGSLLMTAVSGTLVYARLNEHTQSALIHLDAREVTMGGGVAYKNEVSTLRNDVKWSIINSQRRLRNALRGATLTCVKQRAGGACYQWRIDVPEDATEE